MTKSSKSVVDYTSDLLTKALVNLAVVVCVSLIYAQVKKSPLPDAVGLAVDTGIDTYYRLDDGVHINEKISNVLHLLGLSPEI